MYFQTEPAATSVSAASASRLGAVCVDSQDGFAGRHRGADSTQTRRGLLRHLLPAKHCGQTDCDRGGQRPCRDEMAAKEDMDQRLRMTVKYEDYKQYKSQTTITFGEEVKDAPANKPPEKK